VAVRRNKNKDWSVDVLPYIKQELERFHESGIIPTLRSVFYILLSRKIITPGDYNYLSDYTAKCRKRNKILERYLSGRKKAKEKGDEYYNWVGEDVFKILKSHGLLTLYIKHRHRFLDAPVVYYEKETKWGGYERKKYILNLDEVLRIDCFADETRGVIEDFIDDYKTPERYINDKLDFIGSLADNYKEDLIPKWHNQEYYVELWTEKNAMVGTFRSILQDLDVRIVYNRGFDSIYHAWETYRRIKKAWDQDKKVRILYCGDLDPSGDMMDETIKEIMNVFFNVDGHESEGKYRFKRIAILPEHIEGFKLPKNPDKKVLAKLKEDPRRFRFMKKHNLYRDGHYDEDECSEIDRNKNGHYDEDRLFQIEIDALAAFNPEDLKGMILNEINEYYDKTVYDNLLRDEKHSSEHISLRVKKNVQKFLDEQNIKSFMESTF
jgi:hypothetical protein